MRRRHDDPAEQVWYRGLEILWEAELLFWGLAAMGCVMWVVIIGAAVLLGAIL